MIGKQKTDWKAAAEKLWQINKESYANRAVVSGVNTAVREAIFRAFQAGMEYVNPSEYTHNTCPKPSTWFINGGRCGWAHECSKCSDNPIKIGIKDDRQAP